MIWIVGTSVSIEYGGYVTQLRETLGAGAGVTNLSIGDQTSIMGAMRVLAHEALIAPGDIFVWEYSLLDAMIGSRAHSHRDVVEARRMAWECIATRGAHLLVLMWPPLRAIGRATSQETRTALDAAQFGAEILDIRAIAQELGIVDVAGHYRDDRHPRVDSPIVAESARRIASMALANHGKPLDPARKAQIATWRASNTRGWRWLDARVLAELNTTALAVATNSLTSVSFLRLPPSVALELPFPSRVVAVGVVARHAAGALGCGHWLCGARGVALLPIWTYAFLLRAVKVSCYFGRLSRIASVVRTRRVVRAFNAEKSSRAGDVDVFGVLLRNSS